MTTHQTGDSPRRSRSRVYSDIDIHFTANLNSGDVPVRYDLDSIRQSIVNILTTNRGEKPFQPLFGTNLYQYPLFENFTSLAKATVRQNVRISIENWEPRVRVDNVFITERPNDHRIAITVVYTVISPNQQQDQVQHIIERIR